MLSSDFFLVLEENFPNPQHWSYISVHALEKLRVEYKCCSEEVFLGDECWLPVSEPAFHIY